MKYLAFIILHLFCLSLFAQNSKFHNKEFSFSIGIAEFDFERFSTNENLDFINYFDFYPDYLDYITVKLGYKFDIFSKLSCDIKLIMMDDLIPDNFDFSAHYFFNHRIGLGGGSMLFKNYITSFEEYQIQTLPDYYLVDDNIQQFKNYDLSFYLSPTVKAIDNDIFKLLLKFDLGISSFLKKETTFYHKKKLSNERIQYHYKTKTAFQPYIQPKLELRLRVLKLKKTFLGIMINSSYYYSYRSINYDRTIYDWTYENSIKNNIKSPKHKYSRIEFDIGIFLKL